MTGVSGQGFSVRFGSRPAQRRRESRWSRVGDRCSGVQDAPLLRPPFPASCLFGWPEGVVDGGHMLVVLRVDDVDHDSTAVASWIDAVEFHEDERVPRQVAKVDRRDGAALVLRLLGEEEVEGHHAHGAFLVQRAGGWRSKDSATRRTTFSVAKFVPYEVIVVGVDGFHDLPFPIQSAQTLGEDSQQPSGCQ